MISGKPRTAENHSPHDAVRCGPREQRKSQETRNKKHLMIIGLSPKLKPVLWDGIEERV